MLHLLFKRWLLVTGYWHWHWHWHYWWLWYCFNLLNVHLFNVKRDGFLTRWNFLVFQDICLTFSGRPTDEKLNPIETIEKLAKTLKKNKVKYRVTCCFFFRFVFLVYVILYIIFGSGSNTRIDKAEKFPKHKPGNKRTHLRKTRIIFLLYHSEIAESVFSQYLK